MALLTKTQILEAKDIDTVTVAVPEWGGEVLVKGLTGLERDAFEKSVVEIRGKNVRFTAENIRARLAAFSIVDEEGNRMFSDKEIIELGKKSAVALERVFSVASKLSGLSDEDVSELSKN